MVLFNKLTLSLTAILFLPIFATESELRNLVTHHSYLSKLCFKATFAGTAASALSLSYDFLNNVPNATGASPLIITAGVMLPTIIGSISFVYLHFQKNRLIAVQEQKKQRQQLMLRHAQVSAAAA